MANVIDLPHEKKFHHKRPFDQKIVTAEKAIAVINNNDTIATGGFVGTGFPEWLAINLEKRFQLTDSPRNLTLMYAAGQGDGGDRGLNHLGYEGLIKRVIGGHWALVPKLQKLALENKIQAYNFPQGVISHMYRDIAAKKSRTITRVGIGTFVDPRQDGGKINKVTTENMVDIITIDGSEYLSYKTFDIDIALLRGTTADTEGNITMEKEALTLEAQAIAMAVRNSGGKVIVQVERLAKSRTLNPKEVKIPGIMVDYVVVAEPQYHWQTFADFYNPALSGELKIPMNQIAPMALGVRKIISRRAALELEADSIVNLGIGMPEGVAQIAHEEKILEYLTLTAEPGVIGGMPCNGLNFGAAVNTDAIIDQPSQFDFYDGGGLDCAFLGMAQIDLKGNVNVSKFGTKLAGAGGFINISQNAKKVVFMGTFSAEGLTVDIHDDHIKIIKEGKTRKFIEQVEHITFSGFHAASQSKPILYVTERCVFQLSTDGLELIEIAPGIDLDKDIIRQMEFTPKISSKLKLMNRKIYSAGIMEIE